MLIRLSEEEARRRDDAEWRKLAPGSVFYTHRDLVRVYFIAIERLSESEWVVIELSAENNRLLIQGLPAGQSRLSREHASCMDVVSPRKR